MIYSHVFIKNTFCTFVLFLWCSQVFAQSALIDHTISVGQSMSSFYMYNLSEGDQRYKEDYETLLVKADSTLLNYEKEDVMGASDIKQQWQALRPLLNYDEYQGADYFVPGPIRIQYRNYLNVLYKKVIESTSNELHLDQHLALMAFNMEMITARFFDISSSLYGGQSLTSEDMRMDPSKVSKQIKHNFQLLKKQATDKKLKRLISSIENKWNFIERTVVNYEEESAYLLVYYNKRKIHQLINTSQDLLLADFQHG